MQAMFWVLCFACFTTMLQQHARCIWGAVPYRSHPVIQGCKYVYVRAYEHVCLPACLRE